MKMDRQRSRRADSPRERRGRTVRSRAGLWPALGLAALLLVFIGGGAVAQTAAGPVSVRGGADVRVRARTSPRRVDRRIVRSGRRADGRRLESRRLTGRTSRSYDEQRLTRNARRDERSRRDERLRKERAKKSEDRRRAEWERHRKDKKRMVR